MSRDHEMDRIAAQRAKEWREKLHQDLAAAQAARQAEFLAFRSRIEELIPLALDARAKRGYPGLVELHLMARPKNPVVRIFKDREAITVGGYRIFERHEQSEFGATDASTYLLSNGQFGRGGGSFALDEYISDKTEISDLKNLVAALERLAAEHS